MTLWQVLPPFPGPEGFVYSHSHCQFGSSSCGAWRAKLARNKTFHIWYCTLWSCDTLLSRNTIKAWRITQWWSRGSARTTETITAVKRKQRAAPNLLLNSRYPDSHPCRTWIRGLHFGFRSSLQQPTHLQIETGTRKETVTTLLSARTKSRKKVEHRYMCFKREQRTCQTGNFSCREGLRAHRQEQENDASYLSEWNEILFFKPGKG